MHHVGKVNTSPAHGYVPEAYKTFIKTYERLATYTDPTGSKLDILVVYLQKETSLERARTAQRNFVARYLKDRDQKDAGLIAFVSPDPADWRFSLVKMEYKFTEGKSGKAKVKEEFTPAKRWSFLVGKNENSHTAQSRLAPIVEDDQTSPTLKQLEDAFNIEKVTKEFFEKYRELFLRVYETLGDVIKQHPDIKADFAEKNVNTVDFSKKLLGQIVFLYFLQKKGWFGVPMNKSWGNGDKKFLRTLFEDAADKDKNYFNDYLEPLFYEALAKERDDDFYSRFECKIPFLNGGLFDPISNYDWVNTAIDLPDDIFSNTRKTKDGDTGDGILDIFDRYNFTVKEDEPLEKEVAVDPEMLGKVFENLLEVKDRKSKGTYYTPREIVHYMCEQSLVNYLATELEDKVSKEDIEKLIKIGENVVEHEAVSISKEDNPEYGGDYKRLLPDSIKEFASEIDDRLATIKVCDPAIGSGAFPVGMMNAIVKARMVLSSYLKDKTRTLYTFKRDCIQNSLYGVDIDPGAVEIAKLRLWLSLVVDEDDIKQIKPLPNLDYKIVCGDSLSSVEKNLFNANLFNELEKLKPLFFDETSGSKKKIYKKQIDDIIGELTNNHKDFDFEIYFSEVFHKNGGFDVVIANPPYVEHKKLKALSGSLKKLFTTYAGTGDLYIYFYEQGINILKSKGVLTYISSNKFIRTSYGEKLRGLLSSLLIQKLIDFTKVQIFDALVASCVLIVLKDKPNNEVYVTDVDDTVINHASLDAYIEKHDRKVRSKNFNSGIWQLDDDRKLAIKEKIESGSKELGEIRGVHIYRGVTTGYNPAFVINEDIKNKLIKAGKNNAEIIKPLLQGRNIKKWFYTPSNNYFIFTRQKIDISRYTTLKNYLEKFKSALEPGNGRKPGSYKWYEIQDNTAYYQEFELEKIVWGLTADKWAFAYDSERHYLPSNGYILTSVDKLSVKYLLALLNSNLLKFYFGFIGIMTAGGAYTLKQETISAFPVKEIMEVEQESFIDLVEKILKIAKEDDYLKNTAKQAKVRDIEHQIDELVYKLYGLTDDEIKIVEGVHK